MRRSALRSACDGCHGCHGSTCRAKRSAYLVRGVSRATPSLGGVVGRPLAMASGSLRLGTLVETRQTRCDRATVIAAALVVQVVVTRPPCGSSSCAPLRVGSATNSAGNAANAACSQASRNCHLDGHAVTLVSVMCRCASRLVGGSEGEVFT